MGINGNATSRLSVSVDSTADLSRQLCDTYNIQVVPLGVVIGDKIYTDGVDITTDDIYKAVETDNVMPKSNAAPEVLYSEMFQKNSESAVHIHFSLSTRLSSSYDNAVRAAKAFPNVYVIDSKTLSSGTGLLAITAREKDSAGTAPDVIAAEMKTLADKQCTSFVLDNLRYLYKGGRVSGLKLLGANLLKIHPMLTVDKGGNLVQGKKFRGSFAKVVAEYTKHVISSHPDANKDLVFVTYTDIDPLMPEQVERDLRAAGFKRVIRTVAGSVITLHCGRNTIGILFLDK